MRLSDVCFMFRFFSVSPFCCFSHIYIPTRYSSVISLILIYIIMRIRMYDLCIHSQQRMFHTTDCRDKGCRSTFRLAGGHICKVIYCVLRGWPLRSSRWRPAPPGKRRVSHASFHRVTGGSGDGTERGRPGVSACGRTSGTSHIKGGASRAPAYRC